VLACIMTQLKMRSSQVSARLHHDETEDAFIREQLAQLVNLVVHPAACREGAGPQDASSREISIT
jgi:hypothetical protein